MRDIVLPLGEEVPLISLVHHADVFDPLLRQQGIARMANPFDPVPGRCITEMHGMPAGSVVACVPQPPQVPFPPIY
jgi:hypothetical protein